MTRLQQHLAALGQLDGRLHYLIANVTVTDPKGYQPYREQVPAVLEKYGGRFLVRAGVVHPLEGDLGFDRVVVIEFPSMDVARRFYGSAEFAPLLKLRMETTRSQVALVEGYAPQ
jgi:uncharacterized protein (DUF1330 family)